MDLKYGINNSFTLDATLIPDFGQVTFDDREQFNSIWTGIRWKQTVLYRGCYSFEKADGAGYRSGKFL